MIIRLRLTFVLLFFGSLLSFNGFSQVIPGGTAYARFGLGDLTPSTFTMQRGMGDLGIVLADGTVPSLLNPASLARLRLTAYDFAVNSQIGTARNSEGSLFKQNTNFAYGALSFPLTKFWGFSAGVLPYSNASYAVTSTTDTGLAPYFSRFSGNGGLNQAYIANGFSLGRNMSIGVKATYLFGSITQQQYIFFPDTTFALNTLISDGVNLRQMLITGGAQYRIFTSKSKDRFLTLGAFYDLPLSLNADRSLFGIRFRNLSSTGVPLVSDTIVKVQNSDPDYRLPSRFGFGIGYEKEGNWLVGAEMRMQNWADFRSFGFSDSLRNSFQLSLGGQWIPNPSATMKGWNYFKLVRYRAGFRYHETYLQLRETPINEWAFSFGMSLPIRKSFSQIHFAAEYGQRGTTSNSLIQENFLRLTLGFTLNDLWFVQRKYD